MRNFLSNAVKFSYDDSEIKVKSYIPESKDKVILSFEDQGVGIPKENIDKLFKIETSFTSYGTNNEKGSGLGLILCKELVEKLNGVVWVQSTENKGSTFYFALPLTQN